MKLKSLAVALGLTASLLAQTAHAADGEVRVMTFGSTWEKVIKPMSEAFEQETGLKIVPIIQNSSAEGLTKLQASRNDPGVDVWFTGEAIAMRAATDDELFLDLPKDKIPTLSELMPGSVTDKFVAYWYFPTGIVYRKDLVPGGEIDSWQELFSDEMAGKVALPVPSVYPGRTIAIATLMNGGTLDDVTPGIKFLGENADKIAMFHSSDSMARKALASGEISAMLGSPSAVKELADQGFDVTMATPYPTPLIFEGMMMVNGGNEEAAATFIDRALKADWQQHMTNVYNLGPVNVNAEPADALKAILPTKDEAVKLDEALINENLGTWTEEFNAAIAH